MVFFRFSPVNGGYSGKGRERGYSHVINYDSYFLTAHQWEWNRKPLFNGVFTDRSCEHVVHQSAQTPPVHRSVVSAPHQDLRGPATMRAHVTYRWTDVNELTVSVKGGGERVRVRKQPTCTRWCRRKCGWRCRRESTLYTARSPSTSHDLGRKTDPVIYNSHTYTITITIKGLYLLLFMWHAWYLSIWMFYG